MSEKDHDLLIRVHEAVQNISTVVTTNFADHEGRLRLLEKDLDTAKGAIAFLRMVLLALTGVAAILGALWWVKG